MDDVILVFVMLEVSPSVTDGDLGMFRKLGLIQKANQLYNHYQKVNVSNVYSKHNDI